MNRLGMDDSTPIESKMVSRAVESAQNVLKEITLMHVNVFEYDEVLRKQREIIYNERNSIIDSEDSSEIVIAMMRTTLQRAINYYINDEDDNPDYGPFINYVNDVFIQEGELTEEEIKGKDSEDIFEVVWTKIEKGYESQKEKLEIKCLNLNV